MALPLKQHRYLRICIINELFIFIDCKRAFSHRRRKNGRTKETQKKIYGKNQFIIAFYGFYKLLTVNAESHLKTQLMAIMIPWNEVMLLRSKFAQNQIHQL